VGSAEIACTFIGLPPSRGSAERRGSTRSGPGPGALSSRISVSGATTGCYGQRALPPMSAVASLAQRMSWRGLPPLGKVRRAWVRVAVHDEKGRCAMSAKSDQIKGHGKEAAGILTGDKDLESEGKDDRHAAEAEEKIDHARDKVDEVLDKAVGKAEEAVDRTRNAMHRK
jgi:uncharacterized protein YjbJ (UPF0337 family)